MRRSLIVLAAALLLQFTLTGIAHTVGTSVGATVEASTPRGIRAAGHEIPKISNPRVLVSFNVQPNLVGVSVEEFGPGTNPDDPDCPAEHDPFGAGTVNMTVVADLEAGATGNRTILVQRTEEGSDGVPTTTTNEFSEPIGPVPTTGQVEREPVCIFD